MNSQDYFGILKDGVDIWNNWRLENPQINPNLSNIDFSGLICGLDGANFKNTILIGCNFTGQSLEGTEFENAQLIGSSFKGANLLNTNFNSAKIEHGNFQGSYINQAKFKEANLLSVDFTNATIKNAYFANSFCLKTKFINATLDSIIFNYASFVGAVFVNANIVNCSIFGISAWEIEMDEATVQKNLLIQKKPRITVDDIELAQFIYLINNNEKIKNVINGTTSKLVLILGRFSDERKPILESIGEILKENCGFVPIIFDFSPSPKRNLTETIRLLTGLVKFIIADITDAKSVIQELTSIIPDYPSVPVQPIILAGESEYSMFADLRNRPSVLDKFEYKNKEHIKESIPSLINDIIEWENLQNNTFRLEKKNRELKIKINNLSKEVDDKDKQIKLLSKEMERIAKLLKSKNN